MADFSPRSIFILSADTGELEDGAEVAPVAAPGACDRGLHSLEFVLVLLLRRRALGLLSLLRSHGVFWSCRATCAVGCGLSPLCGWR
jgi:hypothetical protein